MGSALAPGDRVGPYRALFRLGKGGMGEVWAARREGEASSALPVALKVLGRDRIGENDAILFRDEARAASALHHPSIVRTIEVGRDGSMSFIAMELVRGPSLTALLQRMVIAERRLDPAHVAFIGIRLADALSYAHERAHLDGRRLRLVHRDVSPHNVLLDVTGRVRLTDFGVARTDVQEHRSRVGTVRGKPSYMAPEQVVGGPIDARTDVFALGIVLYESACLRRLFGRRHPTKSMDAVVRHQPRPLQEQIPGFPEPLAAVIARALEKDPEARPRSAGELALALEAAARGLPGFPNAQATLAAVIGTSFEPGAFDLAARTPAIELEGPRWGPDGVTTHHEIAAAGPEGHPTTLWPSAQAPDPLDPEAIEALRTQLREHPARPRKDARLRTRAVHRSSVAPAPGAEGSRPVHPMGMGIPPAAAFSTHSASAAVPRPARSLPLLVLAGVILFAAIGVVVGRRGAVNPAAPTGPAQVRLASDSALTPSPSPGLRPPPETSKPEPEPAPRVVAVPALEPPDDDDGLDPPVPPPAALPPLVETDRTPVSEATTEAPPTTRRRGAATEARRVRARAARPTPASAAPNRADATYAEVRALLKRVRVVAPERGGAMLATLVEAGRANVDTLNKLREEARRLLEATE